MKRILNIGSVNIDHVYSLPHFVRPGETLAVRSYARFPGGKGFNQSTALARAGASVSHAGKIGSDGLWLRAALERDGVDVRFLVIGDASTGHAVIQVDSTGQNCILIHSGANGKITPLEIGVAVDGFMAGDILLLQNEISSLEEAIQIGHKRGMKIAFNPAPMDKSVLEAPLDSVDLFIVNEVEAEGLCGVRADDSSKVLDAFQKRFPGAGILLTLGSQGAIARISGEEVAVPARQVKAVDTTAAGDTFIGFFLAMRAAGASLHDAMETATAAAAICVTRPGAAPSIPTMAEARSLLDD